VGVLAVEMFLTKDGKILINEVAPRPHNSGHQTIRANDTSQYEQHLRAITGLPLGDTYAHSYSGMLNLLGSEGYTGPAKYEGLDTILGIPGVHPFLYGKKITKPFRKMGHITIVAGSREEIEQKAELVKQSIRVIA
jgi:5-(carboxyamino)imidazole ribonucleotide synthase